MRNFATGDLVIVEEVHRGQWPLSRIAQVHPGKDGVVRCEKIATRSTTLMRPITIKLCFLEQDFRSSYC